MPLRIFVLGVYPSRCEINEFAYSGGGSGYDLAVDNKTVRVGYSRYSHHSGSVECHRVDALVYLSYTGLITLAVMQVIEPLVVEFVNGDVVLTDWTAAVVLCKPMNAHNPSVTRAPGVWIVTPEQRNVIEEWAKSFAEWGFLRTIFLPSQFEQAQAQAIHLARVQQVYREIPATNESCVFDRRARDRTPAPIIEHQLTVGQARTAR